MTETSTVPSARRRPADRPGQVLASGAVLATVLTLGYALASWADEADLSFEVGLWFAPLLAATATATAVAVRARDARRRTTALAATALALAAYLVSPLLLGPSIDVDRFREHASLVEWSGHAGSVLTLVAWGLARRHGRWWWVGLVPAFGLHLASPRLQLAYVEAAPEGTWDVGLWVIGALTLVLGGACCWLVDVLTTRPGAREGVAGLGHEHA